MPITPDLLDELLKDYKSPEDKKWTMPIPHWSQAMQAFSIIFEGRVPTLDGNPFTQPI